MAAANTNTQTRGPARRKPRRMFMPYELGPITVVQPPAELAHLKGDDLFDALTDPERFTLVTGHAPEKWHTTRFVAEIGRSPGRFKAWMVNYYKVTQRGVDRATIEDRVMVAPDGYHGRSPYWLETTARAWAIQEKLMRRDGVIVPYKPPGRPKGATDSVPRQRTATMKASALSVLAAVEELIAEGAGLPHAKAAVARTNKISDRALDRRLTAAKQMREAGVRPLAPRMSRAERDEIIVGMYRLLMADGRRKHEGNARAVVAQRLGATRAEVDTAVDAARQLAPGMSRAECDKLIVGMYRRVMADGHGMSEDDARSVVAQRLAATRAEVDTAIEAAKNVPEAPHDYAAGWLGVEMDAGIVVADTVSGRPARENP